MDVAPVVVVVPYEHRPLVPLNSLHGRVYLGWNVTGNVKMGRFEYEVKCWDGNVLFLVDH